MDANIITLVDPAAGENGNGIAAGAACPVVQTPAHPRAGSVITFRVTCTQAHSYKVYGFTDPDSTTLTDGAEVASVPGKETTSGSGYEVPVFSDRSWAGYALVVTNNHASEAADIGVDRIIGRS
jgi:hypothetical protein